MLVFRRLLTFTSSVKSLKNSSFFKPNHSRPQNFCTVYNSVKKYSLPVKNITVKFHTSRPNHALPPLVWIFVRPVLKIFAILFGRGIRKWWQSLPKNKKRHFLKLMIKKKYPILGSCFAFCGLSFGYYFYHLEEHPITKRKRFIIFTNDQISQLTNLQILLEAETHKDKILPINHPAHRRVQRVVTQLLNGNQDLNEVKEKEWSVTVIDSDVITAFVFLNGHIFVYTGILDTCVNDDQLGVILGHEMAHAILGHVGEKLSNAHVAEMLFIIPLVVLWSVFPDAAAFVFQIISSSLVQLVLQLPYSRSIEREADEIGLQLAAKSCFDVRQASAFWQNMSQIDPLNNEIEFLSSHPSHEHRKEFVEQLIPPALELRRLCKCPNLV